MKCRKAYAIIPVGENDRSAHVAQQKAPEVATPGLFYSVLGGWLNPKAGYQLFFSVQPFADVVGNYTYGKYGISNLSKAQDKLIDGLAEYGARWAKEDGFPEMAEEMEKRVGISKGIEKIIEPQAPKRSRGYEMEL